MLVVSIGIGIITMGLGYFFVVPICVIWTAISVILYNKKLLSQPASHS